MLYFEWSLCWCWVFILFHHDLCILHDTNIFSAKGSIEEENGVSAYGMFGYIFLGWVVLLVALKLTWDRVKKLKTAIHREAGSTETNYLERTGQRIDLSIISVAPPPYDNGPEYPNEAPPPYSPSRRSHSNDVAGSCHRIVLDNFILRSAPPPAYSPSQLPEVDRNTTPVSTNCTELCDGRSQNETISAMRASSGDRWRHNDGCHLCSADREFQANVGQCFFFCEHSLIWGLWYYCVKVGVAADCDGYDLKSWQHTYNRNCFDLRVCTITCQVVYVKALDDFAKGLTLAKS